MEPKIDTLSEKKLVGMHIKMSQSNNKTRKLWQDFMPRKGDIENSVGPELFSIEVYGTDYFQNYDPTNEFKKWAAIEVSDFNSVPEGMQTITLPSGLYAIFIHKGSADLAPKTYRYIYNDWVPKSDYYLDDRPHFAIMDENYKPDSPDSQEEIWIPITSDNA